MNWSKYCLNNQTYNRYVVSVKLTQDLYRKFWQYCKKNNFNKSTGLKNLINSHPEINGNTNN